MAQTTRQPPADRSERAVRQALRVHLWRAGLLVVAGIGARRAPVRLLRRLIGVAGAALAVWLGWAAYR